MIYLFVKADMVGQENAASDAARKRLNDYSILL